MASTCLFLAAKVEEQPRKLEHVIKVQHSILNKEQPNLDTTNEVYLELAQDLVVNENILLQALGFEITVDHPHSHIVKTCNLVRASRELAQTSYFLATNSLHLTVMCLKYKPTIVACVCIYLASKWANLEIQKSSEGKEWFYYVDREITAELIEGLTKDFLAILDKCPSKFKKKLMNRRDDEAVCLPKHIFDPDDDVPKKSHKKSHGKSDSKNVHPSTPAKSLSLSTPAEKRLSSLPSKVPTSSHKVSPAPVPKPVVTQPDVKPVIDDLSKTTSVAPLATTENPLRRIKTESSLTTLTTKQYWEKKQERERIETDRKKMVPEKRAKEYKHPENIVIKKEVVPQHTNIFDQMQSESRHSESIPSIKKERHLVDHSHIEQNKDKLHENLHQKIEKNMLQQGEGNLPVVEVKGPDSISRTSDIRHKERTEREKTHAQHHSHNKPTDGKLVPKELPLGKDRGHDTVCTSQAKQRSSISHPVSQNRPDPTSLKKTDKTEPLGLPVAYRQDSHKSHGGSHQSDRKHGSAERRHGADALSVDKYRGLTSPPDRYTERPPERRHGDKHSHAHGDRHIDRKDRKERRSGGQGRHRSPGTGKMPMLEPSHSVSRLPPPQALVLASVAKLGSVPSEPKEEGELDSPGLEPGEIPSSPECNELGGQERERRVSIHEDQKLNADVSVIIERLEKDESPSPVKKHRSDRDRDRERDRDRHREGHSRSHHGTPPDKPSLKMKFGTRTSMTSPHKRSESPRNGTSSIDKKSEVIPKLKIKAPVLGHDNIKDRHTDQSSTSTPERKDLKLKLKLPGGSSSIAVTSSPAAASPAAVSSHTVSNNKEMAAESPIVPVKLLLSKDRTGKYSTSSSVKHSKHLSRKRPHSPGESAQMQGGKMPRNNSAPVVRVSAERPVAPVVRASAERPVDINSLNTTLQTLIDMKERQLQQSGTPPIQSSQPTSPPS